MWIDGELKRLAGSMGADFVGGADLGPAREMIREQGGAVYAAFPRAVSIGIALFSPIVDQLSPQPDLSVAMSYRHHCYDVVNARLDLITSRLGSELRKAGHGALPVVATQVVDSARLCGSFSHKLAAHLAGLGWIGKSCLLVTPEVGPRARWATVLTDAPLEKTGDPQEERCGECDECVRICPPGAFTGQPYRLGEPREVRYDAHKCQQRHAEMTKPSFQPLCGLCLSSCPYGKRVRSNS